MEKFTRLFLTAIFLALASVSFAQNTADSTGAKLPGSTKAPAKTSKTSSVDTSHVKDAQNQTKFMQTDMQSKKYNFYERRNISTPLMPRYDLDSAVYQSGKKRHKQQEAFKNSEYYFPARPKDAWELGVNFGNAMVSGDVQPKIYPYSPFDNYGVGVSVRKSFGYTFSMRAEFMHEVSTGQNWQPSENLEFNKVLNPFPNHTNGVDTIGPSYYNNQKLDASRTEDGINMNGLFFFNYRTWVNDLSIQFIATLGNINFHKERNIIGIYVLGGLDLYAYQTKYDAVNSQGSVYDFSPVEELFQNQNNNNGSVNYLVKDKRLEALKLLNGILDGRYTVYAEQDQDKLGWGHWALVPSFTVGAGVAFHTTKWMTIALEERVILSQNNQLLDGDRWQEDDHPSLVPHNDNISYTSINFNFHLLGKKRVEPLYWLNPVNYSYKKIGEMNPAALAEELFKDDDNDGVPNYLDREPNTKKGCPVDTHGVALDSDHDGIIDCEDKEPFSPPGYPVDSNGVAIIPPNPCCDTTRRYYNNIQEVPVPGQAPVTQEVPAQPNNGAVGENVVVVPPVKKPVTDCSKIELPFVVFDAEKYYVDPQYYGNLHQIAERMQLCPEVKIVVTGYGEARPDQKFNEQLGWNRANAAVDYLVDKYGISRDRFILKYSGSKKAATGTVYERRMKNKVEFRYTNEGETGESNPPAPHPGIKAGSNK